uniref:Inhibitor of DNA binding 1, HLH protein n=1 Tax=Cynoglossus semilaevis TaxID=244447 RepID=A0A3P8VJB7_CYNSE
MNKTGVAHVGFANCQHSLTPNREQAKSRELLSVQTRELIYSTQTKGKMKVVGSTCALKSKVEILQHVIDYIWDLQVELDEPEKSRPLPVSSTARTPLTTLNAELAGITVENGCPSDRIMCR